MITNVVFDSMVTPAVPGYEDKVAVCNGRLSFHSAASCCPNPRTPLLKGARHWVLAYAWIAPGGYTYHCIDHAKYGRCLLVNSGERVTTRNWNLKHNGNYMLGCLVHCGETPTWRGSAGCLTLPPDKWDAFIGLFQVEQSGVLYVRGAASYAA